MCCSVNNAFKTTYKGGFDVIIGNPPYVDNRGFDKVELHFLYKQYTNSFEKSGTGKFKTTKLNLIAPFIELNDKILKNNGLLSFIFHKNIYKTNSYTAIRKYIINNYDIISLTDWGAKQFEDVVAETATFTLKKGRVNNDEVFVQFYNLSNKYKENIQFQSEFAKAYEFIFGINLSEEDRVLLKKINKNSRPLEYYVNINNGIVTGNDKKFLHKENINNNLKKIVRGKNIKRYNNLLAEEYLEYKKEHLLRARDENIFLSKEKLLMQMINIVFVLTYDNNQFYNLGTTYAITNKDNIDIELKYLLTILNSRLITYYYIKKFTNESSLTNAISTKNLFEIPIKLCVNEDIYIEKADRILNLNKELQIINTRFQTYIKQKFNLEKLSKKLQNWHELAFGDFIKELNKAIKTASKEATTSYKEYKSLAKKEEFEWLDLFEENKQKAQELQTQINQTDQEIDQMIYELYGLTEEEIKIVENS